ncbi:hypothetical protein HAX54_005954, partial [Datura stramonium]|nr:hypothetical protein [Datura stramonium]
MLSVKIDLQAWIRTIYDFEVDWSVISELECRLEEVFLQKSLKEKVSHPLILQLKKDRPRGICVLVDNLDTFG